MTCCQQSLKTCNDLKPSTTKSPIQYDSASVVLSRNSWKLTLSVSSPVTNPSAQRGDFGQNPPCMGGGLRPAVDCNWLVMVDDGGGQLSQSNTFLSNLLCLISGQKPPSTLSTFREATQFIPQSPLWPVATRPQGTSVELFMEMKTSRKLFKHFTPITPDCNEFCVTHDYLPNSAPVLFCQSLPSSHESTSPDRLRNQVHRPQNKMTKSDRAVVSTRGKN